MDLQPAAERLYQAYRQTDPGTHAHLTAHTFLQWLGERIDPAPTAGDVMEFLWGYLPIYRTGSADVPDDDRVAVGAFLKFLSQNGFSIPGSKEIVWDKRTFARRFHTFRSVPFSLWAEELRRAVNNAGFPSTIPPADPEDIEGRYVSLEHTTEGLLLADRSILEREGVEDRDAAAGSKALRRAAYFVEYLGKGKKLTKKGHMALADGKALAEAFGEGHLFDERIGDKVFKTRSSSEIPSVSLTLHWARAAGFVTVRHGRVSPTARGRRLGRDPLDDWFQLFRSFVVKLRWPEKDWPEGRRPFWAPLLVNFGYSYLGQVARRGSAGMALLSLAMESWAEFSAMYHTEHLTEQQVEYQISHMEGVIRREWFGPLADLGAAEVWLSAVEGAARLTKLGLWAVRTLSDEVFGVDEGPASTLPVEGPPVGAQIISFPAPAISSNGHRR